MKLKHLATGVATGYVTRAVQFVATMALVPFLLRPEILGVDDYGRAFTLIAYMAIGTVVTAGFRLSFLRSISQGVGDDPDGARRVVGNLLGTGTVIVLLVCGGLAGIGFLFDRPLLEFASLPVDPEYETALHLALAWMVAENATFLFRAPLMARGAIAYVNVVTMAEVLLRIAALVWLLPSASSPIGTYIGVHACFALLRGTTHLAWSLLRAPGDLAGVASIRFDDAWQAVLYSRSITLGEAASFLVFRAPVVLAARYLGPTESGFIALVINTIQNYIQQILFTVVQPMAVPIAARFDPRRISASARAFFFDLEALYCVTVTVVVSTLAIFAPDLILVWLGAGYENIVLPAQIIIAGCGFEIMYAIRKSLLIGQGFFPEAISRIVGLALVTTVGVWLSVVVEQRWDFAVYATAAYLAASSLFGVGTVWSARFTATGDGSPGPGRFWAFVPSFAIAVWASRFVAESDWRMDLVVGLLAIGCSLACVSAFVMTPAGILATTRKLIARLDRDLFDD